MSLTLHDMLSAHVGWLGNVCWKIGWKVWPFKRFAFVRSWATRQWVNARQKKHNEAAKMLLESGWRGGYCYVDGKPYTLKVYDGHKGDI